MINKLCFLTLGLNLLISKKLKIIANEVYKSIN